MKVIRVSRRNASSIVDQSTFREGKHCETCADLLYLTS